MTLLQEDGHQLIKQAVNNTVVLAFIAEFERLATLHPGQAHGIRDLLKRSPDIEAWAEEITNLLPPNYHAVRGILFDKTPATNWKVAWHQDLTIAVKNRIDKAGYCPWSIKESIVHVQPPVAVLESMLTVRLHLDNTPKENGALKVIPRSHSHGKLSPQQIEKIRKENQEIVCDADAGDILFMKPLVLHASSTSECATHRRIVHIEFAPRDILDSDLEWQIS